MLVTVIVVNWNVRELLHRAIASVYASWGDLPGLEVIVVDNASSDGSVSMLQSEYPQVTIVANRENIGFTRANNQGLQKARGDYVFLLNPDTETLGPALHILRDYLQRHPAVGMVGPQLLSSDGSIQSSRRRFPTVPLLFLESTWLQVLAPRSWLNRYYVTDKPDNEPQTVDWITGAAMFLRREILETIGGMDEGFFMYSEELDLCRRVRRAGWEIHYLPDAQIVHHEGKSSEQVVPSRHIHFQSSKVRYAHKYHGRAIAEVLRAWLLGQYICQICLEMTKWLLGNQREMRAERIKAYRCVIHSGLRAPRLNHTGSQIIRT